MRRSQWALAALMLLAWAAVDGPFVAVAQTPPNPTALSSTVIIFDGSGSMWGKLEGSRQTKLAEARDAVKAALSRIKSPTASLGLMSFGHRRSGDCGDIQVIAAPEPMSMPQQVDRIVAPLEKLNPRGKGPLTAALREASKIAGKTEGPRHLVLIHDDPDNCQQDPCAILPELQQNAPGVTVHVIGIGLKPDDALRYQCLTNPTGGRHVNAQDGAQIASGIGDILQLATLGIQAAPAERERAAAAAAPPPVTDLASAKAEPLALAKDGPPSLRLRAWMTKDQAPTGHEVQWSIRATGSDPAPTTPTIRADGATATAAVAAGSYTVRAQSGLATAEATAQVAPQGETLVEVTLNAGAIHLAAPLAADATVIVALANEQGERTARPEGRPIGIWPAGKLATLVPAGRYVLLTEQGELRTVRPLEIVAGQSREVDLTQAGGRVVLDIGARVGPEAEGSGPSINQPVVFTIEEDDPDSPHGRREIARSAAAQAEFVVAPGTYLVAASRGALSVRERMSVVAGGVVRRTLPLVSARLVIGARLSAAVPDTGAPAEGRSDTFRIIRLDADEQAPLILQGPATIVDVPPGRYRIEARRHNAAIRAEQVVDIRAGEFRPVTLEYQAGQLRMEAVVNSEFAADPVTWHVLDSTSRLVWSSDEAAPSALLGAGRYTVRVVTRGLRQEQSVDIRSGEISTLRLQQR